MSAHSHKNCTIRDLAKYVGMSTCTVSKVLNDREGKLRIAPETRRIIQEAARKLHYAPNVNAQRLFRKRSNVIGFLVP
ncbi:MAG: LacI family DNA-binding transcriptional regulator, partial [Victivallales bacterium]|nr:LacI family DNA-binding transcriptional regulator [Victivallales bacterium]